MAINTITTVGLDNVLLDYIKKILCEQNNIEPEDIRSMKLVNGDVVIQLSNSVKRIEINFKINA